MATTYDIIAGLGLNAIEIELTGSDPDLLANLERIRAVVMYDETEEIVGDYYVSGPLAAAAPSGTNAGAWEEPDGGGVFGEPRQFFRFFHEFNRRGLYIVALSMTADGAATSLPHGIRIGIGDGFPDGVQY